MKKLSELRDYINEKLQAHGDSFIMSYKITDTEGVDEFCMNSQSRHRRDGSAQKMTIREFAKLVHESDKSHLFPPTEKYTHNGNGRVYERLDNLGLIGPTLKQNSDNEWEESVTYRDFLTQKVYQTGISRFNERFTELPQKEDKS